MKIKNPIDKFDLSIKRNMKVLEVGGGHNPHHRSNVIIDKYVDSNYHRSGDVVCRKHQKFYHQDGAAMSFSNQSFDYIICSHVIEHVDDPVLFVKELSRVGKAGYIECPSLVGEYLFPKDSHKWLIFEIDNKLIFFDKKEVGFRNYFDVGELFLHHLPRYSLAYKLLQLTHGNIETVRYEWKGNIDILVNPSEDEFKNFFTKPWTVQDAQKLFPKPSFGHELLYFIRALYLLLHRRILNKIYY